MSTTTGASKVKKAAFGNGLLEINPTKKLNGTQEGRPNMPIQLSTSLG